eukprot:jgi/Bigna1/87412/estExt_fgenesh1_pg.C_200050
MVKGKIMMAVGLVAAASTLLLMAASTQRRPLAILSKAAGSMASRQNSRLADLSHVPCSGLRRGTSLMAQKDQDLNSGLARRSFVKKTMLPGMGSALLWKLQDAGIARADEEFGAESAPAEISAPSQLQAEFGFLQDPILSYRYKYPTAAGGKKLSLITSRKPEKYSSAAPLSNFRHRIVNQMLDYNNVVVYAMYVCPAIGILKRFPPSDWTSQQVADTILLDRLNAKSIEEGRRYLEENVEGGLKYQDEDGTFYFQYEHLEPGKIVRAAQSEGRHNLAVTAARPGQDGSLYLFSLNMGCPEPLWDDLKTAFYEAANSFRIDPLQSVSSEYVPPDKDPWAIL